MAGNYIWYELLTSDPDAAVKFYGTVIGWTCQDSGQKEMDYRQWRMGEAFVGGLMAMPPGATNTGMRPSWLGYINVDNLEASLAGITKAGGHVHMPPTEVPGVGRFAMVDDPQGALFYVMTPIGEGKSTSFSPGTSGHGGWNELHSSDGEAAITFYSAQFGWKQTEAMDMGPMGKYRLFNAGSGNAIGGMMTDSNFPHPAWLYYFCVDDIDAALARVTAAGGTLLFGPSEVPGGAWIINALDPQGAMFALVGPKR